MSLRLHFPVLFVLIIVALAAVVPAAVESKAPPEVPGTSSSNCICFNGGLRRTDVDRCACACNRLFVGPFCDSEATDYASVVITYENKTSDGVFALDNVEKKLRDGLGASTLDVSWLARLPAYEQVGTAEVCVLFRLRGALLERLFADVASVDKPVYLTAPAALDIWMTGLRVAPASRMSQHFASGDVLGEHDLSGLGIGNVFGGSARPTLVITSRHLEYFIGALCVIVAVPLFEGLLLRYGHPSESELDAQHRKYAAPGTAMSKALDSKRKATAARFADIAAKNAVPTQKEEESTVDEGAVNPLSGLKSKMSKRGANGVFNFASLSMGGAKAGSVNAHDQDETPPDAFSA